MIFMAAATRGGSRGKQARNTKPPPSRSTKPPHARKEPLPNTLAFMRLLWAIDHGLRSLSKQMHARIGVTAPQRLVLRIVGRMPHTTPSELADLLHLDRGTLSGIIERLEAQQLIARKAHEGDGRSVLLALTPRGRRLERDMTGTVEACVHRALASLSSSEVQVAKRVLEAVAAELGAGEGEQGA
jgi:MarR family transcriptional regulator, organic hydroperoxide resistance regulator